MAIKKTDTETKTTRTKKKEAEAELLAANEIVVGDDDHEEMDALAAKIADTPDENVYDETPLTNADGEEETEEPIEVADFAIEIEADVSEETAGEVKAARVVRGRTRGGRKNKLLGAKAYEDLFVVTSEDEAMKKIASEMETHVYRKDIMSGNLTGVFRDSTGDVILRVMMKNGMRVFIPATHFFHPDYMAKGQNRMNQKNMNDRSEHLARRMAMDKGAPVRFVPLNVSLFDDGYLTVGSRIAAMERDRQKYFFNGETAEDALVQKGSLVRCAVISTSRTRLRAEFGGAEIVVSGATLSAARFAPANELYAVGSGMDAMVTYIEIDKENNHIEMKVTNPDLRDAKKARARFNSHAINGTYLATVIGVSPPTDAFEFPIYTIVTDENVRGVVYGDRVARKEVLQPGDRISFLCSRKNENRMLLFGRCYRCRA